MALIRWEPFREVDALQREMNRLFDSLNTQTERSVGSGFFPAAEMVESADAVHLKLELPGMNPAQIDIQVTAEAISISGERKFEAKSEDQGKIRTEFRYGSFQRVIPLPARIQNTEAKAEYKDGILTLTLPKAEEEKNKVVKVNIG